MKKLAAKGEPQLDVRLFGRICTYQFKRLPIIGTFVNGLFLAALLVSAAIEGIQTCFHASHLAAEGEPSILLEHPLTYPLILIGFAAVGLLMQWSSNKAHRLREEELESESLLDMRGPAQYERPVCELTAHMLDAPEEAQSSRIGLAGSGPVSEKRRSICLGKPLSFGHPDGELSSRKFSLKSARHGSFEAVPTNLSDAGKVSLKSLKMIDSPNLYKPQALNIGSISADVEARQLKASALLAKPKRDHWQIVRYCISPVALILCAAIVYSARRGLSLSASSVELVIEIADSSLAILVVTLLFTASYPPMKKAGKVLLQSAPSEIDVEALRAKLKSANELIVDIRELHVWSLTSRSNRVATCHVVLSRNSIHSENQLSILLDEVKFKFLEDNIKCSTIQPIFVEPTSSN